MRYSTGSTKTLMSVQISSQMIICFATHNQIWWQPYGGCTTVSNVLLWFGAKNYKCFALIQRKKYNTMIVLHLDKYAIECRPRSNCSFWSSLIWVYTICLKYLSDKIYKTYLLIFYLGLCLFGISFWKLWVKEEKGRELVPLIHISIFLSFLRQH